MGLLISIYSAPKHFIRSSIQEFEQIIIEGKLQLYKKTMTLYMHRHLFN